MRTGRRLALGAVVLLVAVAGFSSAAVPGPPSQKITSRRPLWRAAVGGPATPSRAHVLENPLVPKIKLAASGSQAAGLAVPAVPRQACDDSVLEACLGPTLQCADGDSPVECCDKWTCALLHASPKCWAAESGHMLSALCPVARQCERCFRLHTDSERDCAGLQCCDFLRCSLAAPEGVCVPAEEEDLRVDRCLDACDRCFELHTEDGYCYGEQCCDLLECTEKKCHPDNLRAPLENACQLGRMCGSCDRLHLDSGARCTGLDCCAYIDCAEDICLTDSIGRAILEGCLEAESQQDTPADPSGLPSAGALTEAPPASTTKPGEDPTGGQTAGPSPPQQTTEPTAEPIGDDEPRPEQQSEEPADDDCVAIGRMFDNTTSLHAHMSARLEDFRVQRRVRKGVLLCVSLFQEDRHVCATANHLFQLDNQYLSLREVCAIDGWRCFTVHDQYNGVKWDTSVAGYLPLGHGLYLTPHSSHAGRRVYASLSGRAEWLLRLLTI